MSGGAPQGADPDPGDLRGVPEESEPAGSPVPGGRTVDVSVFSAAAFFSGPLPPPQVLEGYERTLPGLADRITTMAEQTAQHRRDMERKREDRDTKVELRGQVFGFVIALSSFTAGAVLIAIGRPVYGMTALLAAVAGLSGLFIWSRSKKGPATLAGREQAGPDAKREVVPGPEADR